MRADYLPTCTRSSRYSTSTGVPVVRVADTTLKCEPPLAAGPRQDADIERERAGNDAGKRVPSSRVRTVRVLYGGAGGGARCGQVRGCQLEDGPRRTARPEHCYAVVAHRSDSC